MVHGLGTLAVTKKQVEEIEIAEIKMLNFAMGVTRKDKIRNKYIRGTLKVKRLRMKIRDGKLRWYEHVMRREQKYVGRKMMKNGVTGKEKRETKEKIYRCSGRRYGGSWCESLEKHDTLWLPLIERKSQKKRKKKNNSDSINLKKLLFMYFN